MKTRQIAAYVSLGVALVLPYIGLALSWNHTGSAVRKSAAQLRAAAHKDAASAAGIQNLIALCEANIAQSVNSQGGLVTKFTDPRVEITHKVLAHVTVTLDSTIFKGNLVCSFDKSNWNLSGVAAA